MARTPRPIRPRNKVERQFEKTLRNEYLNKFKAVMDGKLARATAASQALRQLAAGVEEFVARPQAGVPIDAIKEQIDMMGKINRSEMEKTFRSALGVDIRPFLVEPEIQNFLKDKVAENVNLIRTIPKRFQEGLQTKVMRQFHEAPFDEQKFAEMVSKQYGSAGYNLKRIVRDQNSKINGQLTAMRHGQLGIESFIWSSSADARVRPDHMARDQVLYKYSEPPDGELPGEPILCFPPLARVLPLGLEGSVAYRYVGDLVQISAGVGIDLTVTPNHPVLTERGWVAACEIHEGDQLLMHRGSGQFAFSCSDPQTSDVYPFAHEVHDLCSETHGLERVGGLSFDLHAQIGARNEKVDVVDVDRELRDKLDARIFEKFPDLSLVLSNFDSARSLLSLEGGGDSTGFASPRSSGDFIGVTRQFLPVFELGSSHSDIHGFARRPSGQVHFFKAQSNGGAGDAQIFRHLQNGIALVEALFDGRIQRPPHFQIEGVEVVWLKPHVIERRHDRFLPDANLFSDLSDGISSFIELSNARVQGKPTFEMRRVQRVRSFAHDGLVYSFQTNTGIIISNGIVTHNCRCVAIPQIDHNAMAKMRGGPPSSKAPRPSPPPRLVRPPKNQVFNMGIWSRLNDEYGAEMAEAVRLQAEKGTGWQWKLRVARRKQELLSADQADLALQPEIAVPLLWQRLLLLERELDSLKQQKKDKVPGAATAARMKAIDVAHERRKIQLIQDGGDVPSPPPPHIPEPPAPPQVKAARSWDDLEKIKNRTPGENKWHRASWDDGLDSLAAQAAARMDRVDLVQETSRSGSWYRDGNKSITMGDSPFTGSSADRATWRHEFGHHMDFTMCAKMESVDLHDEFEFDRWGPWGESVASAEKKYIKAFKDDKKRTKGWHDELPEGLEFETKLVDIDGPSYVDSLHFLKNKSLDEESMRTLLLSRSERAEVLEDLGFRVGVTREQAEEFITNHGWFGQAVREGDAISDEIKDMFVHRFLLGIKEGDLQGVLDSAFLPRTHGGTTSFMQKVIWMLDDERRDWSDFFERHVDAAVLARLSEMKPDQYKLGTYNGQMRINSDGVVEGMSDNASALTADKARHRWHHSKSYYSQRGGNFSRRKEIWANMISIQGHGKLADLIHAKMFPNLHRETNALLRRYLEMDMTHPSPSPSVAAGRPDLAPKPIKLKNASPVEDKPEFTLDKWSKLDEIYAQELDQAKQMQIAKSSGWQWKLRSAKHKAKLISEDYAEMELYGWQSMAKMQQQLSTAKAELDQLKRQKKDGVKGAATAVRMKQLEIKHIEAKIKMAFDEEIVSPPPPPAPRPIPEPEPPKPPAPIPEPEPPVSASAMTKSLIDDMAREYEEALSAAKQAQINQESGWQWKLRKAKFLDALAKKDQQKIAVGGSELRDDIADALKNAKTELAALKDQAKAKVKGASTAMRMKKLEIEYIEGKLTKVDSADVPAVKPVPAPEPEPPAPRPIPEPELPAPKPPAIAEDPAELITKESFDKLHPEGLTYEMLDEFRRQGMYGIIDLDDVIKESKKIIKYPFDSEDTLAQHKFVKEMFGVEVADTRPPVGRALEIDADGNIPLVYRTHEEYKQQFVDDFQTQSTLESKGVFKYFGGGGNSQFNFPAEKAFAGEIDKLSGQQIKLLEDMDTAMESLSKDAIVYRGVRKPDSYAEKYQKYYDELLKVESGDELQFPNYTSTSFTSTYADSFSGFSTPGNVVKDRIMMEIKVPKGTKTVVGGHAEAMELVVSRYAKYRVVEVIDNPKIVKVGRTEGNEIDRFIRLEVIDEVAPAQTVTKGQMAAELVVLENSSKDISQKLVEAVKSQNWDEAIKLQQTRASDLAKIENLSAQLGKPPKTKLEIETEISFLENLNKDISSFIDDLIENKNYDKVGELNPLRYEWQGRIASLKTELKEIEQGFEFKPAGIPGVPKSVPEPELPKPSPAPMDLSKLITEENFLKLHPKGFTGDIRLEFKNAKLPPVFNLKEVIEESQKVINIPADSQEILTQHKLIKKMFGIDVPEPELPKPSPAPKPPARVEDATSIKVMPADEVMSAKVSGQAGSNPGGTYRGMDGVERYVKHYETPDQVYSEIVANNIYRALKIDAPEGIMIESADGKISVANKIIKNSGTIADKGLTKSKAKKVLDGFLADMLVKNWDVVGTASDNVVMTAKGVARIDSGGALIYRARGARKPKDSLNEVDEWEKFTDTSINRSYADVFETAGVNNADSLDADWIASLTKQMDDIDELYASTNQFEDLVGRAPGVSGNARQEIMDMLQERRRKLRVKVDERIALAKEAEAPPAPPPAPRPIPEPAPPAPSPAPAPIRWKSSIKKKGGNKFTYKYFGTDDYLKNFKRDYRNSESLPSEANDYFAGNDINAVALKDWEGKKLNTRDIDRLTSMDDAMDNLSKNTVTYRGMFLDPSNPSSPSFVKYYEEMENVKIGDEFKMPNYISTSYNPELALDWIKHSSSGQRDIFMEIRSPKGTKTIVGGQLDEMEVLLGRNLKYKVVSVRDNVEFELDGNEYDIAKFITLEVIDEAEAAVKTPSPAPIAKVDEIVAEKNLKELGDDRIDKLIKNDETYAHLENWVETAKNKAGVDDLKAVLNETLSEEKTAQYMAIRSNILMKVIKENEIKNSYQTGKGSSDFLAKERLDELERDLFNLGDDVSPTDIPKYNFIADKDGMDYDEIMMFQYGDLYIKFKPELRARSSITLGDSANMNKQWGSVVPASPLNDVDQNFMFSQVGYGDLKKWADDKNYKSLMKTAGSGREYIEVQTYGKMTLDDVDEIQVWNFKDKKKIENALKKAGYEDKIKVVSSGQSERLYQMLHLQLAEPWDSLSASDIDNLGDAYIRRVPTNSDPMLVLRSPNIKDYPDKLRELAEEAKDSLKGKGALLANNYDTDALRAYLREYFRLAELGEDGGLEPEDWKLWKKAKAGFTEDVIDKRLLNDYPEGGYAGKTQNAD